MSFELIEKQVIFEGRKIRLEVHHLRDDETSRKVHREVIVHPGAVVILPFVNHDTIILIKNRRYVLGKQIVELPAGTIDKSEPPMNTAGRELLEETGFLAGKMKPIGTFYTSPGILTENMYAYAAYDLEKKKQALEEGEDIELLQLSYDDAIEMVRSNAIADGKTIATLLMYDRFMRTQQD